MKLLFVLQMALVCLGSKDVTYTIDMIKAASDYNNMPMFSTVTLIGNNGNLQKYEFFNKGYIESALKITRNFLMPKVEYLSAIGIMKLNTGEIPIKNIDFDLFGAEASVFVNGITGVGYTSYVKLVGGKVSIFELQLAIGFSSEHGIIDDSWATEIFGFGYSIGRKTKICALDSCFGIDLGALFGNKKNSNGKARLTKIPKGRVEILKDGKWGTLCGHFWWDNNKGAENICKQIGYDTGLRYTSPGNGTIVAGNRKCAGGEATIYDCPLGKKKWWAKRGELEDCNHSHDQGVLCLNKDCRRTLNITGLPNKSYNGAYTATNQIVNDGLLYTGPDGRVVARAANGQWWVQDENEAGKGIGYAKISQPMACPGESAVFRRGHKLFWQREVYPGSLKLI